ncbi:hypothetical protein FISHEDRAFT_73715 [Fistulina hepatica ATCC 64428]|uniref:WD40 repeat-like protein n=1 Tax=Fistulina hepatica ATCC 64428 TaxID=1128425 RepID=A0A0D7AC11_9AGAR|nr:hypothetical protein FISHEDRAFT_73715 [Fistulina hepatica ATCC 64428]
MCLHEPLSDLYTGSANGLVRQEYGVLLLTGESDNDINVWEIQTSSSTVDETCTGDCLPPKTSVTDILEYALSKFVAITSVSSCEARREDCRQAAIWLT